MGRLGDFLEAVYGATERFTSVRATINHWCNQDLADNARGGNRTLMGRRKAKSDSPSPSTEDSLAVWMALPGRMRVERERRNGGQVETKLTVVNGEAWWVRDHEGHVETHEGSHRSSPGLSDMKQHFDPASLREYFVALALEDQGTVQTAGRDCLQLRAALRPTCRLWPHWLPCGADEYEFHAEPERGVLLSILARYGGQVFETSQVTEVVFDEPLDDALFTYIPAFGEQVRPADPITEQLTLEAAVARMPFVVLVPAHLPDPEHSTVMVMYHPPRLRPSRAYLGLMYMGSEEYGSLWINQSDTPDPEVDELDWEHVERNGRSMRLSDPGAEGMRVVALEQEGTHVTVWSELDRERILDLAASLVPPHRQLVHPP
jgi:hypothetical protein